MTAKVHPIPSAIISPVSNERLLTRYCWTNSIITPYNRLIIPVKAIIFWEPEGFFSFFKNARDHSITIKKNMIICTHLSTHSLFNQFSLGNDEPGIVSSIVEIINQQTARIKKEMFFRKNCFHNIKRILLFQNYIVSGSAKMKGPQKRPFV